jgi:hypothetical protein
MMEACEGTLSWVFPDKLSTKEKGKRKEKEPNARV